MGDVVRYQEAAITENEPQRLEFLRSLQLLDTPKEERYDRIVHLVQKVFNVPISYISLVDEDRQWFKAQTGMDLEETPRHIALCAHTILQKSPLIIEDTRRHPISCNHPAVLGEPHLGFYAGWPLIPDGKNAVGSLCLLDLKPRQLSEIQQEIMTGFVKMVEREMMLVDLVKSQEELIQSQRQLTREQKKNENLIRNIFPSFVVDEIREKGFIRAQEHEQIFVLFSDFVDFTRIAETMGPEALVDELSICFSAFDDICGELGVEKLKTIGDGYFCVTGLYEKDLNDAAARLLECGFRMRDFIAERWENKVMSDALYWDLRVGLHCGKAIAGIVGKKKFTYDVWGDTVNTAARIESACSPGKITASQDFMSFVKGPFTQKSLGLTPLRGKGQPLHLIEVDRDTNSPEIPIKVVRFGNS